jgi:MYXO-CTERM domain-containing protein
VKNRSNVVGIGTATLVGTLGKVEVYRQTINLQVKAREDGEYTFPPYAVAAGSTGTILWTVTVVDQDPDVDVATAKTVLGRESRGGDDHTSDTGVTTASITAEAPATTGGCSSTGGSVGWLGLVGIGLLGAARRRRLGQLPRS